MSNITAIVLSIGEKTTQRAIGSVRRQTLLPVEIVVIKHVSPFHRALQAGAAKVQTDFFVQIDSDMVLDEYCFEYLNDGMREGAGLVFGPLRDPLLGKIACVKLFRKSVFDQVGMHNSISSDTDFYNSLIEKGWQVLGVLKRRGDSNSLWDTIGEHRPCYSPHYTFWKFLIWGGRKRRRPDLSGLIHKLKVLHKSTHEVALIAQIAMAHGVFLQETADLLKPFPQSREFDLLLEFLNSTNPGTVDLSDINSRLNTTPGKVFKFFYRLGIYFRQEHSSRSLIDCLKRLQMDHPHFWLAIVGLGHGIFVEEFAEAQFVNFWMDLKAISGAVPRVPKR